MRLGGLQSVSSSSSLKKRGAKPQRQSQSQLASYFNDHAPSKDR
jgi:hypothetical protein